MALTKREKELLKIVLDYANGDLKRVEGGMRKALTGILDYARRTYLWSTIKPEAQKIIRNKIHESVKDNSDLHKAQIIVDAYVRECYHSHRSD